MQPVIAYIALGSNLGDRRANLDGAVVRLRQTPGVEVHGVSSALENPAVGGPEGSPPFLNAAAELRTTLLADVLLRRLLTIEREMGRERRLKWEPRIIDLDLLLYGDQILSTPELTVPHPLMHERRFVLEPLVEIAPQAMHPTLRMTVAGLLEKLPR